MASGEGTDVGGRVGARSAGTVETPLFIGYRSRGTLASPTAIAAGDTVLAIMTSGYDGSAWSVGGVAGSIYFNADENWTSTNHGSSISFSTTGSGASVATTEKMRISNNGNVGIGTGTPAAKLDVAGAAIIGTGVGTKTIGVVSYLTATNSTTTYIHIKTPFRPAVDSKMYHFKVEGYAYGDSKDIDLTFVGYAYSVTSTIQNPSSRDPQGFFAPTQYIGSDGYIYLRFKPANTYYTSFRVDSTYVGNGRIVTAGEMSVIESTSATL
jgi:hypothetical protein